MVKYQDTTLDRTFAALSDPTRRALLARLVDAGSLSVSELARPLPMSLPAVMKHLDVLADAGLVSRAKSGRTVSCHLSAAPMEQAMEWLSRYEKFWNRQLDRLAAFVEDDPMPDDTSRATKPSLTIKRRIKAAPAKIFVAWTEPAQMTRWFCPEGGEFVSAETDPRVGGRYRIVMRTPDGETHDVSGVYREVAPNEKLVFTWAWKSTPERESLVTVALKSDGEGTLLTLTHEQLFDEAARASHEHGWTSLLGKLERFYA